LLPAIGQATASPGLRGWKEEIEWFDSLDAKDLKRALKALELETPYKFPVFLQSSISDVG